MRISPKLITLLILASFCISLAGCGITYDDIKAAQEDGYQKGYDAAIAEMEAKNKESEPEEEPEKEEPEDSSSDAFCDEEYVGTTFSMEDLEDIPEFTGAYAYAEVNDNIPYFDTVDCDFDLEGYSPLDKNGRCGAAMACVGREVMPDEDEERGSISSVHPSGWNSDAGIYERCHLIGWQLAGENANEKNLITGTSYMNRSGMLPYENKVADYVKGTGNHVLYRVTPIFHDNELVARGVLMEAKSIENDRLEFCVYVYNAQEGYTIDYKTGEVTDLHSSGTTTSSEGTSEYTYVLNTNTRRFHEPDCHSVAQMSEKNTKRTDQTRDEIISSGYKPCGNCHP